MMKEVKLDDYFKITLDTWISHHKYTLQIEGEVSGCYVCNGENIDITINREKAKEIIVLMKEYLKEGIGDE